MSLKYAEGRIKEALRLSGGNAALARQQVIDWAADDSTLLLALTKAHLSGIVAYNIERVMSGRAEAAKRKDPPPQEAKAAAPERRDDFGLEILKAVASSSSAIFGLEDTGVPQKRARASRQHLEAMKAIVTKNKTTKK